MKSLEAIRLAPEFTDISQAAIEYAIGNCAAKLSCLIDVTRIEACSQGQIADGAQLSDKLPEVDQFLSLLGIPYSDRADPSKVYISTQTITPLATASSHLLSHVDTVPCTGISMLIPMSGSPALFGASNTPFGPKQDIPPFVTDYGVGDAILLRQAMIHPVSGQRLPQSHHLGINLQSNRDILTIDALVAFQS